jgi:hypothetical protein
MVVRELDWTRWLLPVLSLAVLVAAGFLATRLPPARRRSAAQQQQEIVEALAR